VTQGGKAMAPKKVVDKAPNEPRKRFVNCCWTINNYSAEDVEKMTEFFVEQCTYGIFGKEVAPTTGTLHLQGYCELKRKLELTTIRKLTVPHIAEIKPRFSDVPKETAGYCKKGDTKKEDKPKEGWIYFFENPAESWDGFEFGKDSIGCPGTRTDVAEYLNKIKNGEITMRELRMERPMLAQQYGRVLQEVENDCNRLKFRCGEMTTCTWIHGLPGRGKSHTAFIDECASIGGYHPDKVYDWDLEQEFQCGYEGQEIVIINEYKGPHQIKYGTLLKIVDKWPFKVKRKNPLAPREFTSKHVIITSVFHPTEIQWNLHSSDDLDQLLDRITVKKLEGANKRKFDNVANNKVASVEETAGTL
jgi:hypothetical protein